MTGKLNMEALINEAKQVAKDNGLSCEMLICHTENEAVLIDNQQEPNQFSNLAVAVDGIEFSGDMVMDWLFDPDIPDCVISDTRETFDKVLNHEQLLCFVSDEVLDYLRRNSEVCGDELLERVEELNKELSSEIAEKVKVLKVE